VDPSPSSTTGDCKSSNQRGDCGDSDRRRHAHQKKTTPKKKNTRTAFRKKSRVEGTLQCDQPRDATNLEVAIKKEARNEAGENRVECARALINLEYRRRARRKREDLKLHYPANGRNKGTNRTGKGSGVTIFQ